jgi:hypothetical protein
MKISNTARHDTIFIVDEQYTVYYRGMKTELKMFQTTRRGVRHHSVLCIGKKNESLGQMAMFHE